MKINIKCECGKKLKREWMFCKNTDIMIRCDYCGRQIDGTFRLAKGYSLNQNIVTASQREKR